MEGKIYNPYAGLRQRRKYIQYASTVIRKAQREERIRNHQCMDCAKKVEVKKYYPTRCDKCQERANVNSIKYRVKKEK